MGGIKQEILKAVAFYDIFGFPLTSAEVYKNLETAADFADVLKGLDELENEKKLILESGYFFLPQEGVSLAEKRNARFLISFKKFARAKKIVRLFAWFPFVRFAGVCNSLGFWNASGGSDIDFFIIAKRGRLWTARFFLNVFLKVFNLRPAAGATKDKICLSFLISTDGLDISRAALPGGDPYFWRWMAWVLPLYDDKIYKKFIAANGWIKKHLPNFLEQDNYFRPRRRILKIIFEKIIGGRLEGALRNFQMKIMPRELREAALRGNGSVVLDSDMVKLHLLDRREEYREKYEKAVSSIMY